MWWSFNSKEREEEGRKKWWRRRGWWREGGGWSWSSVAWDEAMNQNSYSQQLPKRIFISESHIRSSGHVCSSRVGCFFCKVLKNMRVISERCRWRRGKKVKKGVIFLLPTPVKDTDGNIITQGPCGGTWVWIANQEGLLWPNPSLSGRPGINASGETPHCFWLWRLHSIVQPSCPIPTVPSHCAAQPCMYAHTHVHAPTQHTSSSNQIRLDPSLSPQQGAGLFSAPSFILPFCLCFRKEKQIPKQLHS